MLKNTIAYILVSLSSINFSIADETYPPGQLIPILNGCEIYALKYINSLKKNGLINYAYKKNIYTPEFLPKFIGYLEVTETEDTKGKNLPAAIGYNIYRSCKPTIPWQLDSIGKLTRHLKNEKFKEHNESYIIIKEDNIKLFIVDDESIQK